MAVGQALASTQHPACPTLPVFHVALLCTFRPTPTPTCLRSRLFQTELSWLLDDALAALARPGHDWKPASWQQVERDLRRGGPLADAACQYMVQLREPLEALGESQGWWLVQF